jgi:hypothetical protein
MPAPEVISVRRTEEDAGYVSLRPVVRQNFRLHDLLGLVLGVTGKDAVRVRQILRAGNVSFHAFRYSWEGFQVDEQELNLLLAPFPGAEPERVFRAAACTAALLEGGQPMRPLLDLERATIARRRWFRQNSFWDVLVETAARGPLAYDGYSYQWRGDRYRLLLPAESSRALSAAAQSLAPRDMRQHLRALERAVRIIFVCSRDLA